MVYTRNQPVASDDLDISQPFLTTNTNASDDSFGVDHYKFSDLTVNNGFHNKVTTPLVVNSPPDGLPPATVANPILYAYSIGNSGMLQYSRGPNNAVPTPVTSLHAGPSGINLGVGATTNIIDFVGMPGTLCMLYSGNVGANPGVGVAFVVWDSANIKSIVNIVNQGLTAQASGSILQLKNTSGLVLNPMIWTLEFMRIS